MLVIVRVTLLVVIVAGGPILVLFSAREGFQRMSSWCLC